MLYPLQTQGPNIDNAVTQVTQASVELAEAAANYGALKIIFGIHYNCCSIVCISNIFFNKENGYYTYCCSKNTRIL